MITLNQIRKILSSVVLTSVCILCVGAQTKQNTRYIGAEDKVEIIRLVLQQEKASHRKEFFGTVNLTSENIPAKLQADLRTEGFHIRDSFEPVGGSGVRYLSVKDFTARDGQVFLSIEEVEKSNPCFGVPYSNMKLHCYRVWQDDGRWQGELSYGSNRGLALPAVKFK